MENMSVAKGGILVEQKTYRWEINNFEIIIQNENLLKLQEIIFEFMDSNGIKSKWKLWFRHSPASTGGSDSEEGDRELLQVCVVLLEQRGFCSETNAVFDVIGEDAVGRKMFRFITKNRTRRAKKRWYRTITEDLANSELIGGTLILSITLKVFTSVSPVFKEVKMSAADDAKIRDKQKEQYYRKIAKLENDKNNSDVKIVSSDGKEFFAYRWILSEVSDVFEAMFWSDMKESDTGLVKLDDLSGTTVKFLLHFIYTGKAEPQWSLPGTVDELAYAADKYQIDDIKTYLNSNVGKICTVENAGNFLIVTRKFAVEKATANVLLYIREKCKNAEDIIDIIHNTKSRIDNSVSLELDSF